MSLFSIFTPTAFRELVSGRRRGVIATFLRGMLQMAAIPYGLVVRIRNRCYDKQVTKVNQVEVPVVCVGNLTLGGTGKTPFVEWLAGKFSRQGVEVAIVSRGYGAHKQAGAHSKHQDSDKEEPQGKGVEALNDEAMELAQVLPNVPHVQNANRLFAARTAIDRYAAELIVLDDGYQHRRLHRDIDIVLLDASEPFGMEHLFPRGTLREPLGGLGRADVVVLSRASLLDASAREKIRHRVADLNPHAIWCEVDHQPTSLIDQTGQQMRLEQLSDQPFVAFCGIGNPAGFRHTLSSLGCSPRGWREFADHHPYEKSQRKALQSWAKESGAELAVCTRKDLVKFPPNGLGPISLWALKIELQFLQGKQKLEKLLVRVLEQ